MQNRFTWQTGRLNRIWRGALRRIVMVWRTLRRRDRRFAWYARLLRLERDPTPGDAAGLVMIQVDGLSRIQLERALQGNRMPFVRRLRQRERYRLHTIYSGLPSTTPAVQAELFYGVRCAVPAFGFRDADTGDVREMVRSKDARAVEARLVGQGPALLDGGTGHTNIYRGGAREARCCAASAEMDDLFKDASTPARWLLIVLNAFAYLRILTLGVIELGVAVYDAVRGVAAGFGLWKEIKFIPARVAVSVGLRELATFAAQIDVVRGVPIVHVNFLGYDEQAHRRGPASRFAHWSLNGIDDAIKRIWMVAHRSQSRDYDVWIYSDHGQERVDAYHTRHGRTIQETVEQLWNHGAAPTTEEDDGSAGIQQLRRAWLRVTTGEQTSESAAPQAREISVVAKGPIGHVYWRTRPADDRLDAFAARLVHEAGVPFVMKAAGAGVARAWTHAGEHRLPEDAGDVVGKGHPFLSSVATDLVQLCHHRDAGQLVIGGWEPNGRSLSFVVESGAHAGPGRSETSAFALLPADAPLEARGDPPLRMQELRNAVLRHMQRVETPRAPAARRPHRTSQPIRIMTYNVHSCMGMDGRLSLRRVACVIAREAPDVVALQELDAGRSRTGQEDQAQRIADHLNMTHHFHPSFQVEGEGFGNAVLTRLPSRVIKVDALPTSHDPPRLEPRAAIWVAIELEDGELNLINTHLGLSRRERARQATALLSRAWLAHPNCVDPVVFCGDLNAWSGTDVYCRFTRRYRDVQRAVPGHRPKSTWIGGLPVGRIDHIFVGRGIDVERVRVSDSWLARVASDHRPLIVDLRIAPQR